MRILFMSDRYPPHYEGGYEINCMTAAQAMEARGHDVHVLTSMFGVDGPRVNGKVYRVMHPLGKDKGSGLARRLGHIKDAYLGRANYDIARSVAERVGPDIIFFWRMGNVSIFPVRAVQSLNVPVVYRLGDYWLKEYKTECVTNPDLTRRVYRSILYGGYHFHDLDFSNMAANSAALARDYIDNGFPREGLTVIHNGVPKEMVREGPHPRLDAGHKDVRLVCAGRLVPNKGVGVAIEALCLLAGRDPETEFRLDIVGNGPGKYKAALRENAEALGVMGRITFMEQVTREELISSFSDYDAFLFTSVWQEPFGMTSIEAMSQGLPVIASRVGGIPEIIEDGVNGLLVRPGVPEELADAVERLKHEPRLAEKISREGAATVANRFTNDRVMDMYEDYLKSVLRGYRGREVQFAARAQ